MQQAVEASGGAVEAPAPKAHDDVPAIGAEVTILTPTDVMEVDAMGLFYQSQ